MKVGIIKGEQGRTRYLLPDEEERLMKVLIGGKQLNDVSRALHSEFVIRAQQKNHSYLFTNPKTKRAYTTINTAWLTACKLAGITDLRFHDRRHTFGTRAADAGVSLPAIRDEIGHQSTTMTERYAHATDEGKRRAVEAILQKHSPINIATKKGNSLGLCQSKVGSVWILKGF